MKSKLTFGLIATILTSLLIVGTAYASNPLQGYAAYPDFLDHSCGGVKIVSYEVLDNENGTVTEAFRFTTVCAGSGRGSKSTVYQSCWAVSFIDGVLVDRYLLAPYSHWKFGSGNDVACPAL